jgi:hypothetical protein
VGCHKGKLKKLLNLRGGSWSGVMPADHLATRPATMIANSATTAPLLHKFDCCTRNNG